MFEGGFLIAAVIWGGSYLYVHYFENRTEPNFVKFYRLYGFIMSIVYLRRL